MAGEYAKLGSQPSLNRGGPTLLQVFQEVAGDLLEASLKTSGDGDEATGKIDRAGAQAGQKGEQLQESLNSDLSGVKGSASKTETAGQVRSNWPLNQAEAFEKIINAARAVRAGSISEISLKLEPDHLGLMRVRLSVDDKQAIQARIQVESHEARTLIENSLNRLRESLAEQGLKVEKFNVDVRQDHNQSSYQQQSSGAGRDGNSRFQSAELSGRGDSANLVDQKDELLAAKENTVKVHKYSYSTLEWVA